MRTRAACSGRTAAARSITSTMHGRVDIQVGTLSKAMGALGGYVAGSKALIEFLYHRARPFLFSTSHPPSVAATCLAALDVLEQEPEIIERLWDNTRFFKKGLAALGFNTGLSESPITPVIAGEGQPGDEAVGPAVRRGRVRAGHRVSDGRARQGARAHHRDRGAHARTSCSSRSTSSRRSARNSADLTGSSWPGLSESAVMPRPVSRPTLIRSSVHEMRAKPSSTSTRAT